MKKKLNAYEEVTSFFKADPTSNQKAWNIVNKFYHLFITHVNKNNIKGEEVERMAKKMLITDILDKNPNITISEMVKIASIAKFDITIEAKKSKPI